MLAPTLSPSILTGDAPVLGGSRASDATGHATVLRAWVFTGSREYSTGSSYQRFRVACPLSELPAAEWEAMQAETIDMGGSSWGGYVDGYFTLDVSTYHRREVPRHIVKLLPAFLADDRQAQAWADMAGGYFDEQGWLLACPRIVEIADIETRNNVIRFLETKPRKAERQALKAELVDWLNGEAEFPRRAEWMTRPYTGHR